MEKEALMKMPKSVSKEELNNRLHCVSLAIQGLNIIDTTSILVDVIEALAKENAIEAGEVAFVISRAIAIMGL